MDGLQTASRGLVGAEAAGQWACVQLVGGSWRALARLDDALRIFDSRWDESLAATLSPEQLLLYRSNLLGSDLTVTNFGGGNTSAKLTEVDPLTGAEVEGLWGKGSGGDIGSMKLDGFATRYQEKMIGLEAH